MDFRVVYTRSARCLLAIVRRLSPSFSPSLRKNEIRNGIKGWVGEKKWMTFSGWCGAWRSFSSLTCELYCITKAKLSKRGRERKKKMLHALAASSCIGLRIFTGGLPLSRLLYLVYRTLLGLTGISVPR